MFIIQLRSILVQSVLFMLVGLNSILIGQIFLERAKLARGRVIPHLIVLIVLGLGIFYNWEEIYFPAAAGAFALVVANLVFEGKKSYKLGVYIISIDILYTCTLLGNVIVQGTFPKGKLMMAETWGIVEGLSTIFIMLIIKLLQRMPFYNKAKCQGFTLKKNLVISGGGLIYLFSIATADYIYENGSHIATQSVFPLLAVYIIAMGGLWCSLMTHESIRVTYEDEENKLQRKYFKKQLRTYTQLNKLDKAQESLKQEANQSIQLLIEQIDEEKLEDLKPLIEKIETKIKDCKPYIVTGNTMLDMVINEKYDTACKRDIEMKVNISLPEKVGMGNVDLCMLVSNTLDYAMEQCEHTSGEREKSISVEGVWYKGYLMFKLYYTTPGNEISKSKQHSSEKLIKHAVAQDPYGMGTVVKHIRKYEGELNLQECGWGEEKLTFSLNAANHYAKAFC